MVKLIRQFTIINILEAAQRLIKTVVSIALSQLLAGKAMAYRPSKFPLNLKQG
jgi:hypothetical protein